MSQDEASSGREQPCFASMDQIERVVVRLVRVVETKVIEERHKPLNPKLGKGITIAKRFYKKILNLFFVKVKAKKAYY